MVSFETILADNPSESADLVIIGAGIYGIQVARTLLELHPTRNVVILESSKCIGGVWSEERVYDDFWTQTPLGILEFSDQRMHEVPKTDQYYGFFKAKHVAKYLNGYCDKHIYNGSSLRSRIRFETRVSDVSADDERCGYRLWTVLAAAPDGVKVLQTMNLIDASGMTSAPNWPALPGKDLFGGRLIHHKDFAREEPMLRKEAPQKITVIGGAKSAGDVAYSCAKMGHEVTWIIRKSGAGPAAFASAKGSMGYANSNELFYTRITAMFLTSLFALQMGYAKILNWVNTTRLGQALQRRIWKRNHARILKEANYDREDGKENGFYNLQPDTELFWQNDSTGINQRGDFFDVIARNVRVVRNDLLAFNDRGVMLKDGYKTCVAADTIVAATGWRSTPAYYNDMTALRVGLPSKEFVNTRGSSYLKERQVEDQVIAELPVLDSSWAREQKVAKPPTNGPTRLWKSMVSMEETGLLFVGKIMLGNHFRAAEVQALFACAVLDRAFRLPSIDVMAEEVSRTVAWCTRRYPRRGATGTWFYWDLIPYTDGLLDTLGLSSHRHQSTFADLTRPCYAKDLAGLIDEYRSKYGVEANA